MTTRTAIGVPIPVFDLLRKASFSPDGRWVVCLEARESVRVRDAATGAAAGPPMGGPAVVTAAAFSPDSRSLLLGHADGTARIWDLATFLPLGSPVAQRHALSVVAWSPDGQAFLTATVNGAVRQWPAPAVPNADPEALVAAMPVLTAARMDAGPAVSPLDRDEWLERRRTFLDRYGSLDRVLGDPMTAADWHDARARDAEEDANHYAARWHLDRRIAAVPDDWGAILRRMHVRVLAGDPDAAADERLAIGLAGRGPVAVWCQHFAVDCKARGQSAAFAWYTERIGK